MHSFDVNPLRYIAYMLDGILGLFYVFKGNCGWNECSAEIYIFVDVLF